MYSKDKPEESYSSIQVENMELKNRVSMLNRIIDDLYGEFNLLNPGTQNVILSRISEETLRYLMELKRGERS
jgi:hypothetical protein